MNDRMLKLELELESGYLTTL